MKEWKVLRNGEIWGDKFYTLEDAEDYMDGLINSNHSGKFEITVIDKDKGVELCQ